MTSQPSSKFKRNKEDFVCEKCKAVVVGNGYTNHCPICLWSKHVDVNPGDRAASCGGLMKPIALEGGTNRFVLVHQCVLCGHKKRNKVSGDDNGDVLAAIAAGKISGK